MNKIRVHLRPFAVHLLRVSVALFVYGNSVLMSQEFAEAKLTWEPNLTQSGRAYQLKSGPEVMNWAVSKPPPDTKGPVSDKDEDVYYFRFGSTSGPLDLAVVMNPNGKNRLYMDDHGTMNFTSCEPVMLNPGAEIFFPGTDTKKKQQDSYEVTVLKYHDADTGTEKCRVELKPRGCLRGTVTLEGVSHAVALLSVIPIYENETTPFIIGGAPHENENAPPTVGGFLHLDLNGDGVFCNWCDPISPQERWRLMRPTKILGIKDRLYETIIAQNGTRVSFKSVSPICGTLDAGCVGFRFVALSDACSAYLDGGKAQWPLPVGTYLLRLQSLTKMAKDRAYHLEKDWNWTADKNHPMTKVEIRANEVTHLKLGEPFTVSTSICCTGDTLKMTPRITGMGGEQYRLPLWSSMNSKSDGAKNQDCEPVVGFRILDEQGHELVKDNFKYG